MGHAAGPGQTARSTLRNTWMTREAKWFATCGGLKARMMLDGGSYAFTFHSTFVSTVARTPLLGASR